MFRAFGYRLRLDFNRVTVPNLLSGSLQVPFIEPLYEVSVLILYELASGSKDQIRYEKSFTDLVWSPEMKVVRVCFVSAMRSSKRVFIGFFTNVIGY